MIKGVASGDPLGRVEISHAENEVLEVGVKALVLPQTEGKTRLVFVEPMSNFLPSFRHGTVVLILSQEAQEVLKAVALAEVRDLSLHDSRHSVGVGSQLLTIDPKDYTLKHSEDADDAEREDV